MYRHEQLNQFPALFQPRRQAQTEYINCLSKVVNACMSTYSVDSSTEFQRPIFKANNNLYGGLNLNKFVVQISFEKGKIETKKQDQAKN